ncbi:MAG: TIGR01777 family oxidoreductase [Acidobacteriota bacterium]
MKIAVSGAGGLLGGALVERLTADGHETVALVRSRNRDGVLWDVETGTFDADALLGTDAVVHLAGESIQGRWTATKKRRILDSRERGTTLLAQGLARLAREAPGEAPRTLVSASAVGYYGDRGDELLAENAGPGDLFLSDVCRRWEAAADPARAAGLRVVHPRFGVVLSREGGALAAMLTPFRLGVGGRVGDGRQWVSWLHRLDAARLLVHLLETAELDGPVNAATPHPVRNLELTRALGAALHRPTVLPLPAPMVKLALGGMGEELLLASARADTARLAASGFSWRHERLDAALDAEL